MKYDLKTSVPQHSSTSSVLHELGQALAEAQSEKPIPNFNKIAAIAIGVRHYIESRLKPAHNRGEYSQERLYVWITRIEQMEALISRVRAHGLKDQDTGDYYTPQQCFR